MDWTGRSAGMYLASDHNNSVYVVEGEKYLPSRGSSNLQTSNLDRAQDREMGKLHVRREAGENCGVSALQK